MTLESCSLNSTAGQRSLLNQRMTSEPFRRKRSGAFTEKTKQICRVHLECKKPGGGAGAAFWKTVYPTAAAFGEEKTA